MGRSALKTALPAPMPEILPHREVEIARAQDAMPALLAQREAHIRAVAQQVGYQLPADAIDPDLIQRDIAANMRRSVEACLEVGRGLAVLKEACEHGQFLARLEVLGIDRTVASRFAQAAKKFSNDATSHHLARAAGGQSKLFELLVLDDEQAEELMLTGQTGELTLDDVARMGVRELRAALRETRQERDAARAVSARKDERITALAEAEARRKPRESEYPEQLQDWLREIQGRGMSAAGGVLPLNSLMREIEQAHATSVIPPAITSTLEQALGMVLMEVRALADYYDLAIDLAAFEPPAWATGLSEDHGE